MEHLIGDQMRFSNGVVLGVASRNESLIADELPKQERLGLR